MFSSSKIFSSSQKEIRITSQPTNQVASINGTATFSVSAVSTKGNPLYYRWEVANTLGVSWSGIGIQWPRAVVWKGMASGNGRTIAVGDFDYILVGGGTGNWQPYEAPQGLEKISHVKPCNTCTGWFWTERFKTGGFFEDGDTWTPITMPQPPMNGLESASYYDSVIFGNGVYLAFGVGALARSTDGLNWTNALPFNLVSQFPPRISLAFGNGRFVMLAGSLPYTSNDGSSWTQRITAPGAVSSKNSMIFDGLKFIALTGNKYMISADGIVWTLGNVISTTDANWRDIIYGGGVFLATGTRSNNFIMATSSDGTNWIERSVPVSLPTYDSPQVVYEEFSQQFEMLSNGLNTDGSGRSYPQLATSNPNFVLTSPAPIASTNPQLILSNLNGAQSKNFYRAVISAKSFDVATENDLVFSEPAELTVL